MPNICIPSNPDISGIGVRTAIYAQNLLSFGPAAYALLDKKVSNEELDSLETQSTTILITAFAILLSTIVQARTLGLSSFHAAIVLNLSWMNNTNTFIYFLLYAHNALQGNEAENGPKPTRARWIQLAKKALLKPVLIIGSVHLSLMAGVGILLWSSPAKFDIRTPADCSLSTSMIIMGEGVQLASQGLRTWSLFIYAFLLLPGLNLIIPIIGLIAPYLAYNHAHKSTTYQASTLPVTVGLCLLAIINVVFLVDTELQIHSNTALQENGNSDWTFGQTLALLLLLVPLRDLVETFIERNKKRNESRSKQAAKKRLEKLSRAIEVGLKRLRPEQHSEGQFTNILTLIHQRNGIKDDVFGGEDPDNSKVTLTETEYKKAFNAALATHKWEIAEFLIEHSTRGKIHHEGDHLDTTLLAAALDGSLKIVEYLIQCGANVDEVGEQGTALYNAALTGHMEMVNLLIKNDADVNVEGGQYGSALQAASLHGKVEIAYLLIEHHADVNFQGGDYNSALQAASYCGCVEISKLLIEYDADVNLQGGIYGSALQAASYGGHTEIVKLLIEHDANVNLQGGDYCTALQLASHRGHLEIFKLLIEHSADVNLQCGDYDSVLEVASQNGHIEIVKHLIEHKDINLQTHYSSALQAALYHGWIELAKFLIEHDTNINVQDRYGSALIIASQNKYIEIVKLLIEHNADVNFQGDDGSALQAASSRGYTEIVKLLIEYGANVNLQGGTYGSALQAALRSGSVDIIKILTECNANAYIQDETHMT